MADNYVQIRIKATDTATPDLTSLKADLDDLGAKVEEAKATVDTREGRIELADLNARLAALNKRVTSPRIDVAGAAKAEADLAKVDERFDKLKESADKAKDHAVEDLDGIREHASKLHETVSKIAGKGGLLGKLLFGFAGEGGSSLKDVLPFGGSPVALGGIAGAIAAALTEIDGLASGFAAAGVGVGAFAALAVPAFDKVKTAYSNVTAAQAAYRKAQLTESMDPTKSNAAAVAKSLLGLKEAWKGLDPAERGAVHGIQQFMGTWQKMSKAFEPQAFKVFNDGLKIANELLPTLKPFADTAATAIAGLLKQAAGFFRVSTPVSSLARGLGLVHDKTQSILTPFGAWLKQFHQLEGPSMRAIGEGLGHVAVNMGKLLTIMSKKDVVNAINIAFSILDGTLIATRILIRATMIAFDAFNAATKWAGRAIDALVHIIASAFDRSRADIARWAADFVRDNMRVVSIFRALPGRIMSALSSLGGELFSFGAHIIDMLADGIRSAAAGPLGAAMNFVGGLISDFIPHSPAKKGPLSGSGDPRLGGKRIAQMLAEGLTDGVSGVSAAADRVAGGAVMGGRGGRGGGGTLKIELQWVGGQSDAQFMTWLQRNIRARGGSPGIIQNKVVFQ